eukprot:SAG31_NODE_9523_length_1264_cov_1.512446_2_plen_96_part_01
MIARSAHQVAASAVPLEGCCKHFALALHKLRDADGQVCVACRSGIDSRGAVTKCGEIGGLRRCKGSDGTARYNGVKKHGISRRCRTPVDDHDIAGL